MSDQRVSRSERTASVTGRLPSVTELGVLAAASLWIGGWMAVGLHLVRWSL